MGDQLTDSQCRAIILGARIGEAIRNQYPLVAELYRSGMTARQIVDELRLSDLFGVSKSLAAHAVINAIRGYDGALHPPYTGLITDSLERKALALEHGRQSGIKLHESKRGIHALTRDQKVQASRSGGIVAGPLTHRLRIGCHGLDKDVLREHCRRIAPIGSRLGSVASNLARGLVPYLPATPDRVSEIEFAFGLTADPEYCGPVRADFNKIAQAVNETFYGGNHHYTRVTLKIAIQRFRRNGRSDDPSLASPELALAYDLTLKPEYQIPARINARKIALRVNDEYHNGKPVRSAANIRRALGRYRASIANGLRMSGAAL